MDLTCGMVLINPSFSNFFNASLIGVLLTLMIFESSPSEISVSGYNSVEIIFSLKLK